MRLTNSRFLFMLVYLAGGTVVAMLLQHSFEPAHAQFGGGGGAATTDRDATWNSPDMLRARAWVNDYCNSDSVQSKAEAAQHLQALESMTPEQMQLFAATHAALTKSHPVAHVQAAHQQAAQSAKQMAAAQQWWYQNVHKAESQRAMQADRAAQTSLGNISQEETAAANQEESQLQAEQANIEMNQDAKLDDLNTTYPGDGFPGAYWGGAYPGVHYHFHMYPTP